MSTFFTGEFIMNIFLQALLKTAALLAVNATNKKMLENMQNQQNKRSDNDYYKPAPKSNEKLANITKKYAEELGFSVSMNQDSNGSLCYMITKYNRCAFIVSFPAKIDDLPVRIIGSEIFENSSAKLVEEVYIPATVTVIESRAFADCVNLQRVHFSGSIPKMFPDSFCNCYKLQNQKYKRSDNNYYKPAPENNKKVESITKNYAEEIGFSVLRTEDSNGSPCYIITNYNKSEFVVRFPAIIDDLPVRIIGSEIFRDRSAKLVEEVYIPETVTLIESRAFADCVNLQRVHFSGSTPKMFPDSFCNCYKLNRFPVSRSRNIKQPQEFQICRAQLPNGWSCNEIVRYNGYDTTVRFPETINGFPVCIIGTNIFEKKNSVTDKWEVHGIKEIYIPKTVVLIKDCAFMDCTELEEIHFEGDIPEIQPDAFLRCNKLKNRPPIQKRITDPWLKPEVYDTQSPTMYKTQKINGRNAVLINKILGYRAEVVIPEKINGLPVVEIKGGVATDRDERRRNSGNYTLKKLYFPDSVEKIGTMAFMKCWGLESLRLPNNPNLVLEKDCFWGCEKLRLENVTFPDGKSCSDYKDAFGACSGMRPEYYWNMRLANENIISKKSYISDYNGKKNKEFCIISEKQNNIYDALHYYKNVIIDDYEKISTTQKWLLNYVDISNLIFRNGENIAVIPIIGNYKRYSLSDNLIEERRNLYIACIENKTADGKFFDMERYDENILNLLTSMKRKLDVCYYRLSSGYRLSAKHSEMYEAFVREHAKKAVYRAIDTHDKKRLDWCRKLGLINWHYNAVLEYAKRKEAVDILQEVSGSDLYK